MYSIFTVERRRCEKNFYAKFNQNLTWLEEFAGGRKAWVSFPTRVVKHKIPKDSHDHII